MFEPYTVTLTLDAETGWVTAAEWTIDLALPADFSDAVNEHSEAFDEFAPEDFWLKMSASATFS